MTSDFSPFEFLPSEPFIEGLFPPKPRTLTLEGAITGQATGEVANPLAGEPSEPSLRVAALDGAADSHFTITFFAG